MDDDCGGEDLERGLVKREGDGTMKKWWIEVEEMTQIKFASLENEKQINVGDKDINAHLGFAKGGCEIWISNSNLMSTFSR